MKKLVVFVITVPVVCFVALRLAAMVAGEVSIGALAATSGPLAVVAIIAVALALAAWVLSLITGDYSWVDRMWSTVPVLYAWIYASASGFDLRTTVAAALVGLWGLRLTFNFARRGGYTTIEDYRWQVLRGRIKNPLLWQLFNLLFISAYQNLLFVLFTLPLFLLYQNVGGAPGLAFWTAAVALVIFLLYESAADQQQWQFQNAKAAGAGAAGDGGATGGESRTHTRDIARGFRTSGLFALSRHPNYFGEIMIWWCVYALGTTAAGSVIHWSSIGALLLTALFVGSTLFTESITAGRYPDYATYRATTSAIIPWPGRRMESEAAPGFVDPQGPDHL